MPAFLPASMHLMRYAMFLPRLRIVCIPSKSCFTRRPARIEGAVEKGQNLPRGVCVVHGRAEHEAVGRFRLFGELARRVVKDAFARFPALAAGNAVLYGLCTRLENFRFDALFLQRFGDLAEGGCSRARADCR